MQTKVSKRIAKRQNGPKQIAKMHNRIQNLFRNEIKQLKRKINLLQDRLEQFKKDRAYQTKGLKRIAEMQNLSQNELNHTPNGKTNHEMNQSKSQK